MIHAVIHDRIIKRKIMNIWKINELQQLHGHLPPISKTIQMKRTRIAEHCWRSKDKLISDVLLRGPSHEHPSVGRPGRTYLQHTSVRTQRICRKRCTRETDGERERVREIRAGSMTWLWWYIYVSKKKLNIS